MGTSLYQRLEGNNAEEALIERISEPFNLAPIFARTYLEEMRRLFAEHYQVPERPGTARVQALDVRSQPLGPLPSEEALGVPVLEALDQAGP